MKQVSPKILVVDDDPRLRDLLVRYLTEQGFQVHALADSREVDKRLQRDPPHLLVLDLMLPGEDGLALCRRLRGAGETVPIIMLTAKGEDVDRIVGLEMGADDYLPKPFNPRELVARRAGARRQDQLRALHPRPFDADAAARQHADRAHHRRIRAAQGAGYASAPAARAREADAPRAWARSRCVRSRHRRAGFALAQAGRARSVVPTLYPDRLGL